MINCCYNQLIIYLKNTKYERIKKKYSRFNFGSEPTEDLLTKAFDRKKLFREYNTYSPKVFIPLTTMCRDSCGYCTFVKSPNEGGTYLNEEEVLSIAGAGDEAGCYGALFTLGDKPELRWDFALTQLDNLDFLQLMIT